MSLKLLAGEYSEMFTFTLLYRFQERERAANKSNNCKRAKKKRGHEIMNNTTLVNTNICCYRKVGRAIAL